jgi:hypothetical protein
MIARTNRTVAVGEAIEFTDRAKGAAIQRIGRWLRSKLGLAG